MTKIIYKKDKAYSPLALYFLIDNNIEKDAATINKHFDFIINATSASLQNTEIALPASVISETSSCYDLAYASSVTPFLAWARVRGASISDGLGMLVEQAAESFFIWLGERPETENVIDHLRNIN